MFNTKGKEMKKAIDKAWSNPTEEQKKFQDLYFPNGKPMPDEFITTIANIILQSKGL